MPNYSYICSKCGEFTLERSVNDKPLEHCPECNNAVQRIFKPIGVGLCFEGSYNSTRTK